MAVRLYEREQNLCASHAKTAELNKNYIDLIGFLSHELKGILAASVMNVCSVRDQYFGSLNEKQMRALDGAAHSLDYLTVTVRKFLNLGKIEKGELKLNRRETRLKEDIFDNAANVLLPAAARKDMQIHNKIGAGLTLNLDPELIHVVACNLISNAVKYGNEGGKIIVSSSQRDGRISIEVYNDSMPLSNDQQARLFKRFTRLDTPATKNEKGSGLGLFISREIIQLHGGKIWTEARERGNAFIFDIPK
jgi:signal transduction histidine kinase